MGECWAEGPDEEGNSLEQGGPELPSAKAFQNVLKTGMASVQRDHTRKWEQTKHKKAALSGAPIDGSTLDSSPWRAQWSVLEQFGKLNHIHCPKRPSSRQRSPETQRCPQPAALSKDRSGWLARVTGLAGRWDYHGSLSPPSGRGLLPVFPVSWRPGLGQERPRLLPVPSGTKAGPEALWLETKIGLNEEGDGEEGASPGDQERA